MEMPNEMRAISISQQRKYRISITRSGIKIFVVIGIVAKLM